MELVEIILFGSLQFTDIDVLAQKYRLGWVVPLVGTPSCTPKGCGLDSHSGLIPRFQVWSLFGARRRGNLSMFISFSQINKHTLKKKEI